ncbi:hypothetical protein GCM10009836_69150 [Pseudonocardia ailaonensis]|uniref:Peptidase S8/S53 domain-containing protein n=1 Tax=Pseudonocardia ailaonensis TaxID=367279 RepID=A0ABN2NSR1_9PSEU
MTLPAAVLALLLAVAPPATDGLRQVTACVGPGGAATGPEGTLPLDAVHALADGTGVRVAVIDTGVAPNPRLAHLTGGGDYLTGGDGLDDCDGHGTAVAGLLAATPGDDGFAGLAPGVEIVAIRQASPSFTVPAPGGGTRPAGDTATLARAVDHAVALRASVVTISEAVCLDADRAAPVGRPLREALQRAAAADVLVVAAAGNVGSGGCTGDAGQVPLPAGAGADAPGVLAGTVGGPAGQPRTPGAAPRTQPAQASLPGAGAGTRSGADRAALADGVLAVGAVTPTDTPAPFTVRGPWVDLAAPGTGLRSLAPGRGLTGPDLQGTSMAVPIVAGTAALVRQRFPGLSAAEVADRLVATARRAPGGWTDAVGAGIVDPLAALTALAPRAAQEPRPARITAGTPATAPLPGWLLPAALAVVVALLAALPTVGRRLRP